MGLPIYRAEREAGLEAALGRNVLVFASAVRVADKFAICDSERCRVAAHRTIASLADDDLHYLDTVLVTVGWNKNDDVFDPIETWVARATPAHKPVNFEHDSTNIVGHIVSSRVVGSDNKTVPEDSVADALPAKFHVLTGAVLYRYWEDAGRQEQMDKTLAEIAKGEWFVSMECLFRGFDYALRAADGVACVVARNSETAFLTKHLRAYGGSGEFDGQRVGRLLRNIVFSGKGLVKNPANPESIIFDHNTATFRPLLAAEVYSSRIEIVAVETPATTRANEQERHIVDEIAELKAALAASKQKEGELTTQLAGAFEGQKALQALVDQATAKLTESEKTLVDVRDELRGIYEQQRADARLAKVKAALKVNEFDEKAVAAATTFAASLATLTDEQFDGHLATFAALTPAPVAPVKPAVKTPDPDVTVDTAGTHLDPASLAHVRPEVTQAAGLNAVPPSESVQAFAKDVAAFFSVETK